MGGNFLQNDGESEVFHLSHIDLDGYGCQFVTRHFFSKIKFFNANYGREICVRIDQILNIVQKRIEEKAAKNFLILMTDLNLSLNDAQNLHEKISTINAENPGVRVVFQLLDHHISGAECAQKFSWYFLDPKMCASKITLNFCRKNFDQVRARKNLDEIITVINSIDIWDEAGFGFDIGKVALRMIATANELNRNMFDDEGREFRLKLIEKLSDFVPNFRICTKTAAIKLDNSLHQIKKNLLGGDEHSEIMDDIISRAQCNLLARRDECRVFFGEIAGFLSYGLGGISVVANAFLRANPEFKFYIDVNARGNVSLRANGECDVADIAGRCFEGGGHKNAAGGRLLGFKEKFVYEHVKLQIQNALNDGQ